LDVVHIAQLAYQAAPKILEEELSPSVVQTCTLSFISHKMALGSYHRIKNYQAQWVHFPCHRGPASQLPRAFRFMHIAHSWDTAR
jgi:hypothetical protein